MAQRHSLGTGGFSQLGGVHETRSLSQSYYNKSNCCLQFGLQRNKAACAKKGLKALLSLTFKKLDQLENEEKPAQFASGFKMSNHMITSDPFSEQHSFKPKQG